METNDGILQTSRFQCDFCHLNTNTEEDCGLIHRLKTVSCHYFCLLLSTRMVQNGRSKDGILGFLHDDIIEELKKSKRLRCIYCNLTGASVFCCHRSCYKKFHFPCGKRNGALSLFYGTYQSFCHIHRQNQSIPDEILSQRKFLTVKLERLNLEISTIKIKSKIFIKKNYRNVPIAHNKNITSNPSDKCSICRECVIAYPLKDLIWPPCCKGYSWFHKKCIQKYALSAGEHYIRCPLCNDQSKFIDALDKCGIYIPSRDASWERVKGAYMELLERPETCSAEICKCPRGRSYNRSKQWEIAICKYCGSDAAHLKCIDSNYYVCKNCCDLIKPTICDHASESSEDEIDVETISEPEEVKIENMDL